ncbi:signal transduction histidine kinase [Algoriphagus aquaeductus]|uniref:histidine kinase n=1 Tax=Algoriphagus aquaeductus TaxID=475299 RepID=A0A326RMR7_9BACT|nr:ATP-binding protein [Algoriphagus aquaeductus]PZV79739.1 signal transduction histidine kinase [Algoriphagus aquaeductus]
MVALEGIYKRIGHFGLILLLVFCSRTVLAQSPEQLADSLLNELSRQKGDAAKVDLLIEICNNVSYYDLDRAITYGLEGLALSKKIGYTSGTSKIAYILGFVYLDHGNYKEAAERFKEAEQIAEREKNYELLGKISNGWGSWHYMQSDMFKASHYFSKACEYFRLTNDLKREIQAYQNLIATLGEIESYDRSIKLSLEILEKIKPLNDSLQIAFAYNHLIIAYLGIDQSTEAAQYIPFLKSFLETTTNVAFAADGYYTLGYYYEKTEDYDEAISNYETGIKISLKKNFQPAYISLSLGRAYLKKRDLKKAFQYLNEAMILAKESNTMDVYYRACLPMSLYYSEMKDFEKAFEYSNEYAKLNDSILVSKTRQYASFLEASFENNKKEKQISELELSNTQNELTVVRRNRALIITGLLAVILVSIFGFLYRVSRQKHIISEKDKSLQQKQIRFLEQQQQVVSLQSMVNGQETERTRIAKDLHDGLGGLFSTIKMHFSTLQHEQPVLKQDPLFAKSYEMVNTASEEVRRIAHNMMPEVLIKLGLVQAIQDLCHSISAGKLLQVSLQAYGMDTRLSSSTEVMLFRIIQELLNNIIKHSGATQAIIQFNRDGNRLSVTVEDNGKGFNTAESDGKIHSGLSSVENRVNYLNGKLSIDSQKEVGTTVMMDFLIQE